MNIKVDTKYRLLYWGGKSYPCAIGKSGVARGDEKTEGDGKTPTGIFPCLQLFYRKDRLALPALRLPASVISEQDGWCDDPTRPEYNQHVLIPFLGRCEKLWREDAAYNIIVVLGYNINPIIRGKGSAIFLHCAHENFDATEGCVAITQDALLEILPQISADTAIDIR